MILAIRSDPCELNSAVRSVRRAPLTLRILCVLVFGLRALIPAGYMYGTAEGHGRMVMCPAGLNGGIPMNHPGMAHGQHAPGAEQCPFASASAAGLLAAEHAPGEPYFLIVHPIAAPLAASLPAAPPWRYHAPRGPPSLA